MTVKEGTALVMRHGAPAGTAVAAAAATPSGSGTWSVSPGGQVFTTGDAPALGSITGGMVVDAYRGWITDSRTSITVKSQLSPASSNSAPLQFQLRMTQRTQAVDRR